MAKLITPYLFRWEEVEAKSDLERLRLVLDHLPDEALMGKLEKHRKWGGMIIPFDRYGIRYWRGLCISIRASIPCEESFRETGNYGGCADSILIGVRVLCRRRGFTLVF